MSTPTREQVIQMAADAGFVGYGEDMGEYSIPAPAFIARLERVIEAAHTAGRDQGLREAYDIALRAPFKQPELDAEEWESPEAAHDAGLKSMAFDITAEIRAAIEQLRGE